MPNGQLHSRKIYDDRLKRLKENAEGMAGPNGLMGKLEKIYQIVNDSQPEVTIEQIVSCLALKNEENDEDNSGNTLDNEALEQSNISDYHKGLIKQRDELRNKLADRNRALLEIMHQYRELMMELNSLTWPTK